MSLESDQLSFSFSSGMHASGERGTPREWSLALSSFSQPSTSQPTSQSRVTWRGCLSAVFAGIGMAYAYLSLGAEFAYWRGWANVGDPRIALPYMVEAGRLNPSSHIMRMAEAEYFIKVRWKGSGPAAMEAIHRALRTNPNALDLRQNLAGFMWESGDEQGAVRVIQEAQKIYAGVPMRVIINQNPETN